MHSTELVTPPDRSDPAGSPSGSHLDAHPPGSDDPARDRLLDEVAPLVGVVAVAGPPVVLLAGPMVLLALMVAGPFVVLLTFAVLVAGAVGLVALAGAVLAAPYLAVRHLLGRRAAARAAFSRRAATLVPVKSQGRAA